MHLTKILLGGLLASALVAAPLSSASARGWHHRGGFGLFGAVGAVVGAAATIATAPIVILADAARGGYDGPARDGYEGRGYDGRGYAGSRYDGPRYDDQARAENYGPPRGYYAPPPDGYYAQRGNYGPPPGYYNQRPQYNYGRYPGY